jgi:hypothetical protein
MRNTIELSVGDPGRATTLYKVSEIKYADLLQVVTHHNYSPIRWNGSRSTETFSGATGFGIDIDKGLSLDDAKKIIEERRIHAFIATTKSHQLEKKNAKGEVIAPAVDRFRILIPFNRFVFTVKDYNRIVKKLTDPNDGIFPQCDEAVLDGGRQYFPSPETGTFINYFGRKEFSDFNVDDGLKVVKSAFDERMKVRLAKDNTPQLITEINDKTPIWCPFCGDFEDGGVHTNGTPSAVVFVTSKYSRSIYCSHCGKTYQSEKMYPSLEKITDGYYAYGEGCARVKLVQDMETRRVDVSVTNIGWNNGCILMDISREKLPAVKEYMLTSKFIPSFTNKKELSDISITNHSYRLVNESAWEIRHPALPADVADNQFIDGWLEKTFGQHKEFVKQWLSVYCYTNYLRLPILLLSGPKGSGKSLFGDVVSSIFPYLSSTWKAADSEFTEWATAKLLIADETLHRRDPRQYQLLKQLSGQEFVRRNEKYEKAHDVRNNLSVIILSNDPLMVFVEREELPIEESNNPFFVYHMKQSFSETERDNTMKEKLVRRLGVYIRSELKNVYGSLGDRSRFRFQIPTPLTPEQTKLYELNQTSIESCVVRFKERIVDHCLLRETDPYRPYVAEGYIPSDLFTCFETGSHTPDDVIRWMAKHGLIKGMDKVRPRIKDEKDEILAQRRCYEMSEVFRESLNAEAKNFTDVPSVPGVPPVPGHNLGRESGF